MSGGPNSNSRLICETCISRLRDAANFKRQVSECERTLLQRLDQSTSDTAVTGLSMDLPECEVKLVKIESVKVEKVGSDEEFDNTPHFDMDDDDDDLDDQPLNTLATKVSQKSTSVDVDTLDLMDNAEVSGKRNSTAKVKATPVKKVKVKKDPKASVSKPKPEKKKKEDPKPVRKNANLILKYTTASPFRLNGRSIMCVYCGDIFENPDDFRVHMPHEHKTFRISMVFDKLPNSEFVKADITELRCRICMKDFKTLNLISNHLKEAHSKSVSTDSPLGIIPYLLNKESWDCAVCSKNLPSIIHLNKHTVTHFLSFVCDICGRSYINSIGLLKHVRCKHETEHVCYCRRCRKAFPSLRAKQEHQRTDKRCMIHCCAVCSERFPNYDKKQRHMLAVHGIKKKEYTCTWCPLTFGHRQSFYSHFKISHSLECDVCMHCGKKFPCPSKLKRHMKNHAI